MIEIDDSDIGIVIEVKYSDDEDQLEKDCKEALKQIKDRDYSQKLRDAGFHRILKYGIACQIKTCKVLVGDLRKKATSCIEKCDLLPFVTSIQQNLDKNEWNE